MNIAWWHRFSAPTGPSSSRSPKSWSMTLKWSATPSWRSSSPASRTRRRTRSSRSTPSKAPRPSGGASDTYPRWTGRTAHLVPHDAPARPPAIGLRRTDGLGLTRPVSPVTDPSQRLKTIRLGEVLKRMAVRLPAVQLAGDPPAAWPGTPRSRLHSLGTPRPCPS